jgi:hypothetical protein
MLNPRVPLTEQILNGAGPAYEEVPGSAADWEAFLASPIGRWWRKLLTDSHREACRQLIYASGDTLPRLQGVGEVLDYLLCYLDTIPQDKVELESEQQAAGAAPETDDGLSDSGTNDLDGF